MSHRKIYGELPAQTKGVKNGAVEREPYTQILIIGAGMGGILAAIELQRAGYSDFLIVDQSSEPGGVWRDNRYPGCAVDVESALYSIRRAPNPHWSRRYAPREEVWQYIKDCISQFHLPSRLSLSHEVTALKWNQEDLRWQVSTNQGTLTARFVIAAPGAFNDVKIPSIPGLEKFSGPAFHSSQWDEQFDLNGKRVAVIGSGASAVQIVPAIQKEVSQLILLQRSPAWVVPRGDVAVSPASRKLYQRLPWTQKLVRWIYYWRHELLVFTFLYPLLSHISRLVSLKHLEKSVTDLELRKKLTPQYQIGCKRILLSDDYWSSIANDNVELINDSLAEVCGQSVVSRGGQKREVDVIVFATGFKVSEMNFSSLVWGRENRHLKKVWGDSPHAHLGTMVAGFPNFFILQGPNTGLGHSSVLLIMETQMRHVVAALKMLEQKKCRALEPRQEEQKKYNRWLQKKLKGTVWQTGGCQAWYHNPQGKNVTIWPSSLPHFRRRLKKLSLDEYWIY